MTTRRGVELQGLSREPRGPNDIPLGGRGVGGLPRVEPQPTYIKTESEEVINNANGSYIVLGRDRPRSRISGYGGRGETQCASIDIVTGRMSADGPMGVNEDGNAVHVDPSFEKDAARIYLSQKSDIDEYFGLVPGKVGLSQTKSGIGIKADAVRIMGREGIKLITRPEPINSQGGTIEGAKGIDLIAGNDDKDLQPLVKGDNVVNAISRLAYHVGKLNAIVDGILLAQMTFNTALAVHTHQGATSAGMVVQTTPSIDLGVAASACQMTLGMNSKVSLLSHRTNLEAYKMNYLKPWGRDYINSRYNNTN